MLTFWAKIHKSALLCIVLCSSCLSIKYNYGQEKGLELKNTKIWKRWKCHTPSSHFSLSAVYHIPLSPISFLPFSSLLPLPLYLHPLFPLSLSLASTSIHPNVIFFRRVLLYCRGCSWHILAPSTRKLAYDKSVVSVLCLINI